MTAHTHSHHATSSNRTRLSIAIGIIGVVLVVEVVGAVVSGSLALFADAGHMFSDLAGLFVALFATVIAAKPATDRQTFGYQRAEVFGALVNGVIVSLVAVFVFTGGIGRLLQAGTAEVHSFPMLIVAIIGAVANVLALVVLRGGVKTSINMRGAYVEVIGDLFGSVAVVIAAVVIATTGFVEADAIASLVIALMIAPRAFLLLREVFRVLSQAAPTNTDVAQIRAHILGTQGVVDVHDVHVWAITSGAPVFSAHVVAESLVFSEGRTGQLLDELAECLAGHFDVAHSTIQLEPAEHAEHEGFHHP